MSEKRGLKRLFDKTADEKGRDEEGKKARGASGVYDDGVAHDRIIRLEKQVRDKNQLILKLERDLKSREEKLAAYVARIQSLQGRPSAAPVDDLAGAASGAVREGAAETDRLAAGADEVTSLEIRLRRRNDLITAMHRQIGAAFDRLAVLYEELKADVSSRAEEAGLFLNQLGASQEHLSRREGAIKALEERLNAEVAKARESETGLRASLRKAENDIEGYRRLITELEDAIAHQEEAIGEHAADLKRNEEMLKQSEETSAALERDLKEKSAEHDRAVSSYEGQLQETREKNRILEYFSQTGQKTVKALEAEKAALLAQVRDLARAAREREQEVHDELSSLRNELQAKGEELIMLQIRVTEQARDAASLQGRLDEAHRKLEEETHSLREKIRWKTEEIEKLNQLVARKKAIIAELNRKITARVDRPTGFYRRVLPCVAAVAVLVMVALYLLA